MRVLYATDGRSPARNAGLVATTMFDPEKVVIDVIAVVPPPHDRFPTDDYERRRLDMPPLVPGEELAQAAAASLDAAGFTTTFMSSRGTPAKEILDILERGEHELVILGGAHTTWMGTALLGSTSLHVLHHSPTSVLIADEAPQDGGRVLLGVDGSTGSQTAVRMVEEVLDPDKCSINVSTSVSNSVTSVAPPYLGAYAVSAARIDEEEHARIERAREVIQTVSAELARRGFDVDDAVLLGAAGPQLLKEADNIGADLVVVGNRGHGSFRRAILGSVSDQLVRHAPATLVVRA